LEEDKACHDLFKLGGLVENDVLDIDYDTLDQAGFDSSRGDQIRLDCQELDKAGPR
jgi:hypothetical protein